jgi:predicted nucleic acid-binding protein
LIVVRVNGHNYVSGDPDDDPIVRTALTAKVDYLVTADKEILKLGKVQDIEILNAAQFEEKLGEEAMSHE